MKNFHQWANFRHLQEFLLMGKFSLISRFSPIGNFSSIIRISSTGEFFVILTKWQIWQIFIEIANWLIFIHFPVHFPQYKISYKSEEQKITYIVFEAMNFSFLLADSELPEDCMR